MNELLKVVIGIAVLTAVVGVILNATVLERYVVEVPRNLLALRL